MQRRNRMFSAKRRIQQLEGEGTPATSEEEHAVMQRGNKTSSRKRFFQHLEVQGTSAPIGNEHASDSEELAENRKKNALKSRSNARAHFLVTHSSSILTKHSERGEGGETITCVITVMDLQELPEGCIAHIISLTSPRDACRLSLLSKTFKSAADSDAVWDKFLPPETRAASPEKLGVFAARTKKEVYLALCPVLFNEGKLSFSLDKWSGKKCYMISARELGITWSNTPIYWKWISHPESRFAEVAELLHVCWLEIHGKLETRLLSPSTLYKGYLVFKFTAQASGFAHLPAEVTMGLEGRKATSRTEFLHSGVIRNDDRYPKGPKVRSDGWLEIEMGEFFCEAGRRSGMFNSGMLKMHCLANGAGHWKRGLIVQGIEVRPNRQC